MSDWDRFVSHDPELDKQVQDLIVGLVAINKICKKDPDMIETFAGDKARFLSLLLEVQIKRGVMKGPEDEHMDRKAE